jgi:hypothetical protein
MAQRAIRNPTDVYVQQGKMDLLLTLHGELNIPVQAIQVVEKLLQLFWSMWSDDKSVVHIMEPAKPFVGRLL